MNAVAGNRAGAGAPCAGHRRRYSKSHISRSSVYETVEEEISNVSTFKSSSISLSKKSSPMSLRLASPFSLLIPTLFQLTRSRRNLLGMTNVRLRKYYALRDEAENVMVESKHTWLDTPISLFALQSTCLCFFPCNLPTPLISFPSTRKPSWDAGSFRLFCSKLPSTSL